MTREEDAYCDRNICLRNEYNGIGCDECEVTKSQEPNTVIATGDGAYYKIKALQTQADGEYISRQAVMDCYKKWQPYMATRLHEFEKELSELPSVAIPTDIKQAYMKGREDGVNDFIKKSLIDE